jgi:hypothetical protein
MTSGKDFKRLIRKQMKATGKPYSEVRRDLLERDSQSMARPSTPSPALDVESLSRLSTVEAIQLVDDVLGPPESWPSALIFYRLSSEFQAGWKAELGQWLRAAAELGFLDQVLHQLRTQAKRPSKSDGIDPNDLRHLKLHQHLAAARNAHYFTRTGWSFGAFEPETGGAVDIDLSLVSPTGELVEFQVKAPDQPGRVLGGHIVEGEFDDRVVQAVNKACRQLRRPAKGPAVISICANRSWPLSWDVGCLVKPLIGSTLQVGSRVFLERARAGAFFREEWSHVSAVVVLDVVWGVEEGKYLCVVLLNPKADFPVGEDWFPGARVAVLEGNVFRWARGEPGVAHTLPDGTALVEEVPNEAWSANQERTVKARLVSSS